MFALNALVFFSFSAVWIQMCLHQEDQLNCHYISVNFPFNVSNDTLALGGKKLKEACNIIDSKYVHFSKEPKKWSLSSAAHENWQTHRVKCALGRATASRGRE